MHMGHPILVAVRPERMIIHHPADLA